MPREQRERELKFVVPAGFELPDLSAAVGADRGDAIVETSTQQLDATYYDTDDRHLQRAGITLRRRRGGEDDGWHLKLPDDDARTEIQLESRATSPPREFAELVLGIRLGQPLRPVLKLRTLRERHQVVDGEAPIAEIAVDEVTAARTGDDPIAEEWRELEIELCGEGSEKLLGALAKGVRKAGAKAAPHASKYARGIGAVPARPRLKGLPALVDDYLEAQREAIADGDLRLRRDENVVHKTRVAIRRTRSTLRVFADQFDAEAAAGLDAELEWYAAVLGRVRDLDIVRARLQERLGGFEDGLVTAQAESELTSWLAVERESAWRAVRTTLRGRRYRAMLVELDRWRVDTPWTETALQKKGAVTSYVGAARKTARNRLARAVTKTDSPEAYHGARKATKRWRYAVELACPQLGGNAKKRVKRLKRMQDDLGAVQDAVMAADTLRSLTTSGNARASIGFSYGLLFADAKRSEKAARRRVDRRYG